LKWASVKHRALMEQSLDQSPRIAVRKGRIIDCSYAQPLLGRYLLVGRRGNGFRSMPGSSSRTISTCPTCPNSGDYSTRRQAHPFFLVSPERFGGSSQNRQSSVAGKRCSERVSGSPRQTPVESASRRV